MLNQKIQPMEPVPHKEPFNSPDHLFQVKWDGVRMLAFINNGTVRLQNRRLHERTLQYPEMQLLPRVLSAFNAILDGEMVVFHQGKPSFPLVIKRDFATRDKQIAGLMELVPVTYMLFDILYINGRNITALPLVERQSILAESITPCTQVLVTDNFTEGKALFTAVREQGLEGIVAKAKHSPYLPGKKHSQWLKIKYRPRRLCVVGGYTKRGKVVNTLLLGAYDQGKLRYLGRVGSGLTQEEWQVITGFLEDLRREKPPFANPPLTRKAVYYWVVPALTVLVEFTEWTEEIRLRQPVIVGFSSEHPEQCQLY